MNDARFLFLMRGGFDRTVIDSQVVDALVAVATHGIRFDLLALTGGNTWISQRRFQRMRARQIAERTGGRVRAAFTPGQGRPGGDLGATARVLFEVYRHGADRSVIHARGEGAGYYASRVQRLRPRLRYLYDVRGDSVAEFLAVSPRDGSSDADRERSLNRIEREQWHAIAGASHVICVSAVLRDRLLARYDLEPERVTVIPCVADPVKFCLGESERTRVRAELGLQNRFVVVYPGRFGLWHYSRETIEVVKAMVEVDPSVYFLILTPDVDEAQRLTRAALPAGSYSIRTEQHGDVPRYLRAADLGLLLREPHPLNEVACPTKFAEYMMSGLPVLISRGIGDCSDFVARNAAGAVLNAADPAEAVAALSKLRTEPAVLRRERIAGGAAVFSRERVAKDMAELYQRLASE